MLFRSFDRSTQAVPHPKRQFRHGWCSFATVRISPHYNSHNRPLACGANSTCLSETVNDTDLGGQMGIFQSSRRFSVSVALVCGALMLTGCGGGFGLGAPDDENLDSDLRQSREGAGAQTLGEALRARRNAESIVQVNRYIWSASLQVLDFLPIQSVDPFTGVIVTGYGTPPGGGRAYRATVLISDPALDARSLNVALQTRNGAASAATVRAVEDAILTRARQLRVSDNRL